MFLISFSFLLLSLFVSLCHVERARDCVSAAGGAAGVCMMGMRERGVKLALCGGVGVSESCAFVQCMFGPCGV